MERYQSASKACHTEKNRDTRTSQKLKILHGGVVPTFKDSNTDKES